MQMPSDVTLTAFVVLMDFVNLYDYVKRDSKVRGVVRGRLRYDPFCDVNRILTIVCATL